MISLRAWFRHYISLPLLLASGLTLASTLIQIYEDFETSRVARDYSVQHSKDIIGIGLRQHNRVLVEAALDSTSWQINSLWAVLCVKDVVWVASRIGGSKCPELPNHWFSNLTLIQSDVPGFYDYQIRVAVPRIPVSTQTILLTLVSLVLVFIFAMTIRRTQSRLVQDIFSPLQGGLENIINLKIRELFEIKILLREAEEAKTRESVSKALIQAGQQVMHDIKSPLAALRAVLGDESVAEDSRALLKAAIGRIDLMLRELSFGIDKKYETKTLNEGDFIQQLLKLLILEKRAEYINRKDIFFRIDSDSNNLELPSRVDRHDLFRVLSNLINNSIEASPEGGHIVIVLGDHGDAITIEVKDDGIGIPAAILPRLARRGITFGKKAGSGLGLFHAKNILEGWGGALEITSVEPHGTSVKLIIPQMAPI